MKITSDRWVWPTKKWLVEMVERAFSTGYILEDYGDKMLIVAFWYFLRMYIYIYGIIMLHIYIYIVGYSNHFFRICCPENDRYIYIDMIVFTKWIVSYSTASFVNPMVLSPSLDTSPGEDPKISQDRGNCC